MRIHHLQKEPLCRYCTAAGDVVEATVVDHVIPHRWDVELFWHGELQSLCTTHHNGSKQAEEHGGRSLQVGMDGYPIR